MKQVMPIPKKIVIKGAGDLASGVAHRLWYAGFDIVMLELPQPQMVRRSVSFASAVFSGTWEVEGVTARLCDSDREVDAVLSRREVAVIIDPGGEYIRRCPPAALVDAVMAKTNTGTSRNDARLVIALGPGFCAPGDVHAVVETRRGHNLGKVFYRGSASPNTGTPGEVGGVNRERVLRAPAAGRFQPCREIGDLVEKGETVAKVGDTPVIALTGGLLRGLLYPGLEVNAGMKVGDVDPRGAEINWHTISDKARAVGGGVLEALLHLSSKVLFSSR